MILLFLSVLINLLKTGVNWLRLVAKNDVRLFSRTPFKTI